MKSLLNLNKVNTFLLNSLHGGTFCKLVSKSSNVNNTLKRNSMSLFINITVKT